MKKWKVWALGLATAAGFGSFEYYKNVASEVKGEVIEMTGLNGDEIETTTGIFTNKPDWTIGKSADDARVLNANLKKIWNEEAVQKNKASVTVKIDRKGGMGVMNGFKLWKIEFNRPNVTTAALVKGDATATAAPTTTSTEPATPVQESQDVNTQQPGNLKVNLKPPTPQ